MDAFHKALISIPPLIVAVVLHEVAHGWVANKLGDPTATKLGRITLNPIKHIDPYMTLFLPGLLILAGSPIIFGGAKPVPVDPRNFKNPRKGMLWVALAGPVTNFILAALSFVLFRWAVSLEIPASFWTSLVLLWLLSSVFINLILGLFNLLPVPPLDGGRIAVGLLPLNLARQLARVEFIRVGGISLGFLIVIAILMSGALDYLFEPVLEFMSGHLLNVP